MVRDYYELTKEEADSALIQEAKDIVDSLVGGDRTDLDWLPPTLVKKFLIAKEYYNVVGTEKKEILRRSLTASVYTEAFIRVTHDKYDDKGLPCA